MRGAGGYDFAARPSRTCLDEPVFWTPESHSGVVFLVDVPPGLPRRRNPSDALATSGARAGSDGISLHHPAEMHDIQVLIIAGSSSVNPLAAVVPLDDDGLDRIEAIEQLWRALHQRHAAPRFHLTHQQRHRLREMLRAVDGRADGASYREIAEVLFGTARVSSDPWKTSPLRDRTYRLVRSGARMIGGGYRSLLRHRHRP